MSNFKQQLADFKKNTPKQVQWLLLAIAFIVVLILMFLLLGNKQEEPTENILAKEIELEIIPNADTPLDWQNTPVG
ncbi:MAG: hypothetical protein IKL37_02105, partial [Alphaproteobacteria bacterium]|nr:hypothetical protein [Alphaproteobacteria bacterium]